MLFVFADMKDYKEKGIMVIIPTKEKIIKITAPSSTDLLEATFVILMVCVFSVKVVDPPPVPHIPANILQKPSIPIPLLTIPRVGGFEFTRVDVE